nr:uncharacterized protein [Tanacetum cinerariifolium]
VKEVLLKLNLPGHKYSIQTVKRSSRNMRIRRWRYNLIPAESKFKTPMLNHQSLPQSLMYKLFLERNIIDIMLNQRLGINATKGSRTIKVVTKAIHGVAKDVSTKIGEWEGTIDLSVVSMDDFNVVLGLEFLDKVRDFPMPFSNSLCILDGGKTCMVSTERDAKKTDEGSSKAEVPKAIEWVLEEFKDVMPNEFPKKLPLKREVDHTIELEMGSRTPAKALYRMPPPELEGLHKKLKKIMDAGYIQPSKVPYDLFDQLRKARYFTKLDLTSRTQDQGWRIDDGRCKDKGYPRLGITNQGYGVEIFPWLGELLPQVYHGILGHSIPFDGPIEEVQSLDMGRRVPNGVQEFEESGYERASAEATGCDHDFRATHECIRLFYLRSSNLRWTPDSIREPEVKRDRKEMSNIAISYFQTQKKLSPKQARCQDFLAEFDYQLEYKPGKANVVAEALSRKAKFVAISQDQFFLQDRIKEGLEHDPLAKKIIALAKDRRTRRFWLKRDMLFTKGDRLYVSKWGDLRRAILKECHDSKCSGHLRISRTLALVEGTYYWLRMGGDVETFSVSMDFITCLPNSKGGGSIIVVVDRVSKYETFIATPPDVTADDTTKLFFKNMASLDKVAKKTKKWADERRRHVEFEVEYQVMVKLLPQQFKSLSKVHKGLIRRYEGLFSGDWACWKGFLSSSTTVRGVPSYKEYLIKWRDLPDSEASWEAEDLLWQFADEIKRYHEDGTTRTSRA